MKNPCFRSKDDQCSKRCVGCRNTCLDWRDYEVAKQQEYAQRRKLT